jgi:hypothetical protein
VALASLQGQEVAVPRSLEAKVRAITKAARAEAKAKARAAWQPFQQLLQTPGRGDRVRKPLAIEHKHAIEKTREGEAVADARGRAVPHVLFQ